MDHLDDLAGSKSFIYGPSTANIVSDAVPYGILYTDCEQRIEAWWSQLRRFKTHWWIELCRVCLL